MSPKIFVEKDGIRTDVRSEAELANFLHLGYELVEEIASEPAEKVLTKAEAKAKAKAEAKTPEDGGDE